MVLAKSHFKIFGSFLGLENAVPKEAKKRWNRHRSHLDVCACSWYCCIPKKWRNTARTIHNYVAVLSYYPSALWFDNFHAVFFSQPGSISAYWKEFSMLTSAFQMKPLPQNRTLVSLIQDIQYSYESLTNTSEPATSPGAGWRVVSDSLMAVQYLDAPPPVYLADAGLTTMAWGSTLQEAGPSPHSVKPWNKWKKKSYQWKRNL